MCIVNRRALHTWASSRHDPDNSWLTDRSNMVVSTYLEGLMSPAMVAGVGTAAYCEHRKDL